MFIDNYDIFMFDLDDTLIMTEHLHHKCWVDTIKEFKGDFNIDFLSYSEIFHTSKENGIQQFLIELGIENVEYVTQRKNKRYSKLIKDKTNTKLKEMVEPFFNQIISNGKDIVIVTNTQIENVRTFLEIYPVLNLASKIYTREMFQKKKPNPECYNLVLTDFPNKRYVGFEDSLTGIHAMSCIPLIDIVFVNSPEYKHYFYIINNYKLKQCVNCYKGFVMNTIK